MSFLRSSLLAQTWCISHIRNARETGAEVPGWEGEKSLKQFCEQCGKPLFDGASFCGSCGSHTSKAASPTAKGPQPVIPIAVGTRKSSALKVTILALVAALFVGGALAMAGIYYAAHQVHQRFETASAAANSGLRGTLASGVDDRDSRTTVVNPCRFLTKEEVGAAIGAHMTRVETQSDGCVYYAQGDPASMVTKHTGALLGGHGASPKEQQMVEQVAGAFFQQQQSSDKNLSAEAAKGEVPALTVSFSRGNADAEMRLNEKLMGGLGSGPQPVAGVGDQAFSLADTSMTFRKGQTLVRLMYPECPCNTQSITPLARRLAAQL
jgi:hypothetical protein